MASSWGLAWGVAWGSSWGAIAATVPDTSGGVSEDDTNPNAEYPPDPNYLICQRSGERVPVSEGLVKEWTGLWVRRKYRDPRHPQELVRIRPETVRGSVSPPQEDSFIEDEYGTSGVTIDDLG